MQLKLLLFVVVFLLVSGVAFLYRHSNRLGVNVSKSTISSLNGNYYFNKNCNVNLKMRDMLPFGCFEKENTYATSGKGQKGSGLPDLVGIEKLVRQKERIEGLPMIRFFRIPIDKQKCIWYLDLGGEMISSKVGVSLESAIPPETGWSQAMSFTLQSFGRSSDASSSKQDGEIIKAGSTKGLLSIVFGGNVNLRQKSDVSTASPRSHMNLEQSPFLRDISRMPQTVMLISVMVVIFIYQKWNQST